MVWFFSGGRSSQDGSPPPSKKTASYRRPSLRRQAKSFDSRFDSHKESPRCGQDDGTGSMPLLQSTLSTPFFDQGPPQRLQTICVRKFRRQARSFEFEDGCGFGSADAETTVAMGGGERRPVLRKGASFGGEQSSASIQWADLEDSVELRPMLDRANSLSPKEPLSPKMSKEKYGGMMSSSSHLPALSASELDTAVSDLPSLGSADHASATCRPCAHSWRGSGCLKGAACAYCHICGGADFQAYKRKQRRRNAVGDMADPEKSVGFDDSLEPAAPLASLGSAVHGKGLCRPCAHSWKPDGCSKGQDCEFCHMCTAHDFHQFRKMKRMQKEARLMARSQAAEAQRPGRDNRRGKEDGRASEANEAKRPESREGPPSDQSSLVSPKDHRSPESPKAARPRKQSSRDFVQGSQVEEDCLPLDLHEPGHQRGAGANGDFKQGSSRRPNLAPLECAPLAGDAGSGRRSSLTSALRRPINFLQGIRGALPVKNTFIHFPPSPTHSPPDSPTSARLPDLLARSASWTSIDGRNREQWR